MLRFTKSGMSSKKNAHARGIGGKDLDTWLTEKLVESRNASRTAVPVAKRVGGEDAKKEGRMDALRVRLKLSAPQSRAADSGGWNLGKCHYWSHNRIEGTRRSGISRGGGREKVTPIETMNAAIAEHKPVRIYAMF